MTLTPQQRAIDLARMNLSPVTEGEVLDPDEARTRALNNYRTSRGIPWLAHVHQLESKGRYDLAALVAGSDGRTSK